MTTVHGEALEAGKRPAPHSFEIASVPAVSAESSSFTVSRMGSSAGGETDLPNEEGPDRDDADGGSSRRESRTFYLRANAELGFLAVLAHRIQFGKEGTSFDYAREGGQDVLFPVSRYSIDLDIARHHTITFLYQPLRLDTREVIDRDVRVYDLTFTNGTPMAFRYDFPFYRLSYLYDFFPARGRELAIGASLQLRDATIDFASLNGESLYSNRDVGPVPLLKLRWTEPLSRELWVGVEADGIYAPISVLNGSTNEVVGALLDASARAGIDLPMRTRAFLNVRYLGGGAVGTSSGESVQGDGYVDNWLHFLTVSLGFSIDL
jgi:hypothetical protein